MTSRVGKKVGKNLKLVAEDSYCLASRLYSKAHQQNATQESLNEKTKIQSKPERVFAPIVPRIEINSLSIPSGYNL